MAGLVRYHGNDTRLRAVRVDLLGNGTDIYLSAHFFERYFQRFGIVHRKHVASLLRDLDEDAPRVVAVFRKPCVPSLRSFEGDDGQLFGLWHFCSVVLSIADRACMSTRWVDGTGALNGSRAILRSRNSAPCGIPLDLSPQPG